MVVKQTSAIPSATSVRWISAHSPRETEAYTTTSLDTALAHASRNWRRPNRGNYDTAFRDQDFPEIER